MEFVGDLADNGQHIGGGIREGEMRDEFVNGPACESRNGVG